jgi:hypothetical protein
MYIKIHRKEKVIEIFFAHRGPGLVRYGHFEDRTKAVYYCIIGFTMSEGKKLRRKKDDCEESIVFEMTNEEINYITDNEGYGAELLEELGKLNL